MNEPTIGQLGVSALHPTSPEFLSAAALFHSEVNLDSVVELLNARWKVGAEPRWENVSSASTESNTPANKLMHFTVAGLHAILSLANEPLTPSKGTLPNHSHYVALTLYAKSASVAADDAGSSAESHATPASEQMPPSNKKEIQRRRTSVLAHILLTQISDALMHQPHAVGIFRAELGIVQPPAMVTELAPLLTQGQIPLPLWINIRIQTPQLTVGRTLGLPLFGHLDLEILESTHTAEDVYAELGNIATYIITSDAYLLPGQTVGSNDGEEIAVTHQLSTLDHTPVIRIMY